MEAWRSDAFQRKSDGVGVKSEWRAFKFKSWQLGATKFRGEADDVVLQGFFGTDSLRRVGFELLRFW